jgi:hypothetical protein
MRCTPIIHHQTLEEPVRRALAFGVESADREVPSRSPMSAEDWEPGKGHAYILPVKELIFLRLSTLGCVSQDAFSFPQGNIAFYLLTFAVKTQYASHAAIGVNRFLVLSDVRFTIAGHFNNFGKVRHGLDESCA